MTVTKRSAGQPLSVPYNEWNQIADVTNAFNERRDLTRMLRLLGRASGTIIQGFNATGAVLEEFYIASIDTSDWDPTDVDQQPAFFSDTAVKLKAVVADDEKIVVVKNHAETNDYVTSVVTGVVPCQVDVQDITHIRAKATADPTKLTSDTGGPALILSSLSTTGTQWCLVLLDRSAPDTQTHLRASGIISPA